VSERRTGLSPALAVALAAAAAGCDPPRMVVPAGPTMMAPGGPDAASLARLGWPILVGFLVVTAVMWVLFLWAVLRRKGTLAEHAPVELKDGRPIVVVGGFIIPALAFGTAFVATLHTMHADGPEHPVQHMSAHGPAHPVDIVVTGRQWWWKVDYASEWLPDRFTTANEIHIPVGRPVEVEIHSTDVIHSFWVPALHGKVDLVPGLTNRLTLQADAAGVYPGECAEYCGQQHAKMKFLVIAEPEDAFGRWQADQRQPAPDPGSEEARRGRDVFLSKACVVCHTIRGTLAHGSVGPDLTHLGSRRTIAAGSLPKDLATLHAWVVNAPSLKPGTLMPRLDQLTGPELHDLVAYLQSLG
jgi:cytochrome c oxidase subunit 2